MYTESTARTNRLWCSDCGKAIKKGAHVTFELSESGHMLNVYCSLCSSDYLHDVILDSIHPFSGEALGQE